MKKLISTIMALTVACTGLASMTAGAVGDVNPFDRLSETEEFADYELICICEYTPYTYWDGTDSIAVYCKKYAGDDGETCYTFREVTHRRPSFDFIVYGAEKDVFDKKVADILNSYEGLEYAIVLDGNNANIYSAAVPDDSCIEEIYSRLSEATAIGNFYVRDSGFSYRNSEKSWDGSPCALKCFSREACDLGNYEYGIYSGVNSYDGYYYEYLYTPTFYRNIKEEKVDAIAEYIEEKNLDFTLKSFPWDGNYGCVLIPNYDITFDEHMEVAMDIAGACSVCMPICFDNRLYNEKDILIDEGYALLEMKDEKQAIEDYLTRSAKSGDANVDGAMNIADAAAVVQALGNKDKYGLSAQGEFNADVDGNGLTGADALAIQMMVAEAGMPE